jgi:hypothetical protein
MQTIRSKSDGDSWFTIILPTRGYYTYWLT